MELTRRDALTAVGLTAVSATLAAREAAAQQKEVLIGMQCDRTGATQITGVVLCPAMHDYYNLINAAGGVEGYKIKVDEIDNEYKVPSAVEAYQRHKQMGAVLMTLYGTPMTVALNQRLQEDKIPTTSPGFGISAAAEISSNDRPNASLSTTTRACSGVISARQRFSSLRSSARSASRAGSASHAARRSSSSGSQALAR